MKTYSPFLRPCAKHLLLILLALLSSHHLRGQNYLTIYRNDGVRPEMFYHESIDSLVCSCVDMNGVEHATYQVQEIWLKDTVYRLPLAVIDSITMKKISFEQVIEKVTPSLVAVGDILLQDPTLDYAQTQLDDINAIAHVLDAWIDGNCLYVYYEDLGTIPYVYPVDFKDYDAIGANVKRIQAAKSKAERNLLASPSDAAAKTRVSIAFQPYMDDRLNRHRESLPSVGQPMLDCGIEPVLHTPGLSYFEKEMWNYDAVFLITHGGYSNHRHWMMTSDQLFVTKQNDPNRYEEAQQALSSLHLKYPLDQVKFGSVLEKREGKDVLAYYLKVSDLFFHYKPKTPTAPKVLFSAVCKSLFYNDVLAYEFLNQGVGCYLGFTEENAIGYASGRYFFENLLNGMSVKRAFDELPDDLKIELREREDGNSYTAVLERVGEKGAHYFLLTPSTGAYQRLPGVGKDEIKLQGQIKSLLAHVDVSLQSLYAGSFGFALFKKGEKKPCSLLKSTEVDFHPETTTITWATTFPEFYLEPNTSYTYKAYLYDGFDYSYGEEQPLNPCPVAYTRDASNIAETSATLNGLVSANGAPLNEWVKGFIISLSADDLLTRGQYIPCGAATQGAYSVNVQNLVAGKTYYYIACLRHSSDPSLNDYGIVSSFTTSPHEGPCPDGNHPHMIDLGIGVKWACCNLGARTPEEYGGYYAWGELTTKSEYTVGNYQHNVYDSDGDWTGYSFLGDHIGGTAYDAARALWHAPWRMPTAEEMRALATQCTSTWTTQNGVKGRKFVGPNGNSIFLPAAGGFYGSGHYDETKEGCYWSDTFVPGTMGDTYAYGMYIFDGQTLWDFEFSRDNGFTVRPVAE